MKAVFESVIVILTLIRARFLVPFQFLHPPIGDTNREDWFVEVADDCTQTCRVLENMVRARSVEKDLNDCNRQRMKDLGGALALLYHLLTITSDIRIVRRIKSVVSKYAHRAPANLRGHCPELASQCLAGFRTEMWGILRVLGVGHLRLMIPTVSKLSQRDLELGGGLEINEIIQQLYRPVDTEPPLPAPETARCYFATSTLLPLTAFLMHAT